MSSPKDFISSDNSNSIPPIGVVHSSSVPPVNFIQDKSEKNKSSQQFNSASQSSNANHIPITPIDVAVKPSEPPKIKKAEPLVKSVEMVFTAKPTQKQVKTAWERGKYNYVINRTGNSI